MAHKWAKWLPHPCRIGGSPPLQSGGQSEKWPTSGQNGYLTPSVSGDPHRFRAGGKVKSGPQVDKVAASPLPYRGSPPLQSGGQNQKWPTSGRSGYLTRAVSGMPTASERGAKSEVAHKWAKWLPHPCRIGDPHRFKAGGAKSEVAHKWAKWLPHPCRIGDAHRFTAGGQMRSGPQVGKVATSPLPYRGIPTASERGAKLEVAHKWAKWLPHPCRIGGSPPLQSGGQSQKWPTSGQSGYLTPAVSGDPHRFRAGGQNRKWPTNGQSGYLTPAVSGIPTA